MTEEIRQICLYVETCLDRKEGTRDCAKCEHHLNYWTEVMIRDMERNIKRLEQENKELLEAASSTKYYLCGEGFLTPEGAELYEEKERYRSALEEISLILNELKQQYDYMTDYSEIKEIQNKINEVLK